MRSLLKKLPILWILVVLAAPSWAFAQSVKLDMSTFRDINCPEEKAKPCSPIACTPVDCKPVPCAKELPDIDKAPRWSQVIKRSDFIALSSEKKKEVQDAYFKYWVLPHVIDGGLNQMDTRHEFLSDYTSTTSSEDTKEKAIQIGIYTACAMFLIAMIHMLKRHIKSFALFVADKTSKTGSFILSNATKLAALSVAIAALSLVVRMWMQNPFVIFMR